MSAAAECQAARDVAEADETFVKGEVGDEGATEGAARFGDLFDGNFHHLGHGGDHFLDAWSCDEALGLRMLVAALFGL